jgi:hypothetical protein
MNTEAQRTQRTAEKRDIWDKEDKGKPPLLMNEEGKITLCFFALVFCFSCLKFILCGPRFLCVLCVRLSH